MYLWNSFLRSALNNRYSGEFVSIQHSVLALPKLAPFSTILKSQVCQFRRRAGTPGGQAELDDEDIAVIIPPEEAIGKAPEALDREISTDVTWPFAKASIAMSAKDDFTLPGKWTKAALNRQH
jgi:hypothetical protein